MPPKKKAAAKPPPKAAPRMPTRLPTRYINAPLQPRRGWKGPPLPFTDIDGALAWGISNDKLEEAQDLAGAFMVSDGYHRERAKAAEDELEGHSKRGAGGRFVPRNTVVAERAGAPDPNAIRVEPMAQNSRGRAPLKTRPPPTPKKEPPPATAGPSSAPESPRPSAPKKEPPPAPKEPPPEETPAAVLSKRAHEKVEEAQIKEDDFRAKMKQMQIDLEVFRRKNRTAKRAMPLELKERAAVYTPAALEKLVAAKHDAEKRAAEALLANQGVTQRKMGKK